MRRQDRIGPNRHYRDCVMDVRLVVADALTAPTVTRGGGWSGRDLSPESVEILRRDCGCRVKVLLSLVVSSLQFDGAKLEDWLAFIDRVLVDLPE